MKTMSAREAKNAFGLMIDTARAEPVLIEKHGRGVVMVIAVEEYERLMSKGNALGESHALVTHAEKNAERNLHRGRARSAPDGRGALSDGSPQRAR
jgi:prevent-host-death family protein